MIIGKVVGSVVSTRKNDNLIGNKFMIVEPIPSLKVENRIVAIDKIGAGIGEYVLVAQGSAARVGCGMETAPVDAAIVGIIDEGQDME
ncbi:MAG: EutN/CcmL family microcompartment protein [Firmicutes bacterium]|jgi:carbon dioxide concentrating mechanism/carboxysome shell protein|nr:EutN/CcmL family microcompartment protein [Bacillota bacterium]